MRSWLHRNLDLTAWQGKGLSPLNWVVFATILIAISEAVVQTEQSLQARYAAAFQITDLVIGAVFTAEYAARLWIAGDDPRYAGGFGRLRYLISPLALIDLVAILPFLLSSSLSNTVMLRLIRLLRILSLAKFGRFSSALSNVATAIRTRADELMLSLLASFILMLVSATAMYLAEEAENPEQFGSIPRALWWGVATVTKVGYGGAFPETVLGRVFAAVFALAAVGIVALPTGILAAAFAEAFRNNRGEDD